MMRTKLVYMTKRHGGVTYFDIEELNEYQIKVKQLDTNVNSR
jgi:hypothetical protein